MYHMYHMYHKLMYHKLMYHTDIKLMYHTEGPMEVSIHVYRPNYPTLQEYPPMFSYFYGLR